MVEGLFQVGVPVEKLRVTMPEGRFVAVDGVFDDADDLWVAMKHQYGRADEDRKRWHLDDPIVDGETTWVLHSNWGTNTRDTFKALLEQAPPGFAVFEEGDPSLGGAPAAG